MYYSKMAPYGQEAFKCIVNTNPEHSIKHKQIHTMQKATALSLQKKVNTKWAPAMTESSAPLLPWTLTGQVEMASSCARVGSGRT